ncbi:hypothetical protein H2200_012924 [Cladophialophora chaetospira]|uniref:Stress-response A/B barrel domain-containing protein n=1 Tax=Cladophialophora chaetospira TaxID=386627 RepID=A0AA38WX39_9EURO|nr:hypothetical protein H2200_012924 [Cladophialophora chaetospira]
MPIVLFRLKDSYTESDFISWKSQVEALVGVIPGLRYVDIGNPLASTAFRAKGFDLALVAILERPEDAPIYAEHPKHVKIVEELRPKLFDEVVVFDLQVSERI